jgi:hypothetical protein
VAGHASAAHDTGELVARLVLSLAAQEGRALTGWQKVGRKSLLVIAQ